MKKLLRKTFLIFLLAFVVMVLQPATTHANHTWNNYHWARTSNPFVVKLGHNVSPQWETYLFGAAYYWNRSSMLDIPVVRGGTSAISCRATTAHVQVCSAAYGTTGWLGIAQIWVSGNHITRATVKLNDTFFNTARYNTPAWRNLVMCQEVGHAFGLGHQDENFSNTPLGSCMDYSSNPDPNQWPNMHDYYQLLYIYSHVDTSIAADESALAFDETTLAGSDDFHDQSEWGTLVSGDTHLAEELTYIAAYERDLGDGKKVNTVVIWAQEY